MTVDALISLVMQNPVIFFFGGLALAISIGLETRRSSVMKAIPDYGIDFMILLSVSAIYIFVNPTPTGGLERVADSLADAVFVGSVIGIVFKIVR
mgnify:CR=1 FL=1